MAQPNETINERLAAAGAAIVEAASELSRMRRHDYFAEAIELLLIGTPWEKPTGYDFEGLYERTRSAIRAGRSAIRAGAAGAK